MKPYSPRDKRIKRVEYYSKEDRSYVIDWLRSPKSARQEARMKMREELKEKERSVMRGIMFYGKECEILGAIVDHLLEDAGWYTLTDESTKESARVYAINTICENYSHEILDDNELQEFRSKVESLIETGRMKNNV